MTLIKVTTKEWDSVYLGMGYDAEFDSGYWKTNDPKNPLWFLPDEVRVVGKYAGGYDPNHPGELDPDSWDRMGYARGCGKHVLETGAQ
jgi:hypothetical protein